MKVLFLLTICFSLTTLFSFNEIQKIKDPGGEPLSKSMENFKMNCVILTRAQIQTWVDSGWTNPGNPNVVKNVVLQFYTADASSASSNMQLIAYPGQTATSVQVTGRQTLEIDNTCASRELTGAVIFGNNTITLENLKILKSDGTLNDFDYIRFTPEQNYPPYVNFKVEIIKSGQQDLDGGGTLPCPYYCCPPYC